MDSKKLHLGQNGEGYEDRLSNLPDPLITHILSFLETKYAVRTSVLSTKWCYFWTTVTTLRFDDFSFRAGNGRVHKSYFIKFVEKALLLGSPTIHDFNLKYSDTYDASRIQSWISAVVRRNVRKIEIYHHGKYSFVLPRCLYNCDSVRELILWVPCTFNVPTSICFSSLKLLKLSGVTFLNAYSFHSSELQFTFPVLEELYLFDCRWLKVKVVNINAPKLNIFYLYNFYERVADFPVKLHISSPQIFYCGGYGFVEYILSCPSSVLHASFRHYGTNSDEKLKNCLLICTLLRQFSSLKYLTLSCENIQALASIEDLQESLPTFNNLVQLTITSANPVLDGTLISLLQSLPVLETLIIDWGTSWFYSDEKVLEVVPPCFQTRLKVVKFQHFNGREDGLELAKFLLKNAMVLEEMIIIGRSYTRYCSGSVFAAVKEKLLAFPKGSDHALISFN